MKYKVGSANVNHKSGALIGGTLGLIAGIVAAPTLFPAFVASAGTAAAVAGVMGVLGYNTLFGVGLGSTIGGIFTADKTPAQQGAFIGAMIGFMMVAFGAPFLAPLILPLAAGAISTFFLTSLAAIGTVGIAAGVGAGVGKWSSKIYTEQAVLGGNQKDMSFSVEG